MVNIKTHLVALTRAAYSNCKLYSPEGELMCRLSKDRTQWYLDRGLAEVISASPVLEVRLLFAPKGMGKQNQPYYLADKHNSCVVCAAEDNLTRHHCIPKCFRKHMPSRYREHTSYDVLLMCDNCHWKYEVYASKVKFDLLPRLRVREENVRDRMHAATAARALRLYGDSIPEDRKELLMERISVMYGAPITEDTYRAAEAGRKGFEPAEKAYQEFVDSIPNLEEFIVSWRQHFVDVMQPKHLPSYWTVDGECVSRD